MFPLGETIVTWTAADNYNNTVSSEQIIIVVDTTMPVIEAPNDYRIEASHIDQNIIDLVGVRVSDQVEISTITNDAPDVFPLGETIVTWTATDSSGNSATSTQTVTIVDTTSPVLLVPENLQIEAQNLLTEIVDFGEIILTDINYKDQISRYFQNTFNIYPKYEIIKIDNNKYICNLFKDTERVSTGEGTTIKGSEQDASKNALIKYGVLN